MRNEIEKIKNNLSSTSWLIIFSMLMVTVANAQTQSVTDSLKRDSLSQASQIKMHDTRPMSQRIGFDIATSFWINAASTFFECSPVLVYKFPKTFSVGAGPSYIYKRDRVNRVNLHGLGGKVFGKANLTSWFYAYTEYQGIDNQYISDIDLSNNKITRSHEYVDSWFLSLGLHLKMGKRHGINLQALYDVLYNRATSPYYGAWTYRIGFGF